jgi:hypothetical protein
MSRGNKINEKLEGGMKTLTGKLEELFVNITFAEEREFSAAREAFRKVVQKGEDTFTAIAFAEAGEFETAANYISKAGEAPRHRKSGHSAKRFTRPCTGRA